jgi:DNA-binding LacI/PurR family transcriptional regulator
MRLAMLEQMAASGRYAAALYVHLGLSPQETAIFELKGVPLGYLAGSPAGVEWVVADEADGAWQATHHLMKLGHSKIALISAPPQFEENAKREQGYRKALREKGIVPPDEYVVYTPDWSKDSGEAACKKLLALPDRPTAIFVPAGDLVARGAMQAIHGEMLKMPDDISIIGYDDMSFAQALIPPLSTVRQPIQQMAEQLARGLIAQAENRQSRPLHGHIKPELVLRLSAGPPAA